MEITTIDNHRLLAEYMRIMCSPKIYEAVECTFNVYILLRSLDFDKKTLQRYTMELDMIDYPFLPDNYKTLEQSYNLRVGDNEYEFADVARLVTSFMWSYMSGREELTRWDHNQLIWVG